MGHRSFLGKRIRPQVLKPSENYDRSPHPNARNYAVEMAPVNGNVQLSESQNELARKKREEFTNEVSRRMGDLLLRSWTMLDCYCTQCNGILMEKGETRECIQCTVFAELQQVEPGSARTTAEIG
ncbi:unnamed protein product [Auanema sp. JU1783]|nr:unnamed protein product [Auanema sp. JU1783]